MRGVYQQMEAFREGFSSVFPLKLLNIFEPDEVSFKDCIFIMIWYVDNVLWL